MHDGVASAPSALPRTLGTWSAVAVVVGTIIGSGIFGVPASIARDVGSSGAIAALWILGGAIALCGALSLSEVTTAFPRAGGMYVVLRETYGSLAAFLFGWALLIVNPASYAAVALILAAALRSVFPFDPALSRWIAAGALAMLTLINYRSLRYGAALQNVSTLAKTLVLVGLAFLAFGSGPATGALAEPVVMQPLSWSGFGLALIAVMFSYDGWQWAPQLAEEMKTPERSLPRALAGGVAIVIVVYLLTNAANLYVLTMPEVASSPLVTADVATRLLGAAGAAIVGALIVVSTLSSNNAAFMTDPRVFYAMAQDGLFFRKVAAVHPRYRTPHIAVLFIGFVAIAWLPFRTFEQLLAALILGMWPFLALAVLALLLLRRRRPDLARPFRVPGYPFVPIFFLVASAGIMLNAIVTTPVIAAVNFAILGAGIPVYFLWRAVGARRPLPPA